MVTSSSVILSIYQGSSRCVGCFATWASKNGITFANDRLENIYEKYHDNTTVLM